MKVVLKYSYTNFRTLLGRKVLAMKKCPEKCPDLNFVLARPGRILCAMVTRLRGGAFLWQKLADLLSSKTIASENAGNLRFQMFEEKI